jgi:hypothetical protein
MNCVSLPLSMGSSISKNGEVAGGIQLLTEIDPSRRQLFSPESQEVFGLQQGLS